MECPEALGLYSLLEDGPWRLSNQFTRTSGQLRDVSCAGAFGFWLPCFASFCYCSCFFGFALLEKVIAQKHFPLALLSGTTHAKTISNLIFFS